MLQDSELEDVAVTPPKSSPSLEETPTVKLNPSPAAAHVVQPTQAPVIHDSDQRSDIPTGVYCHFKSQSN